MSFGAHSNLFGLVELFDFLDDALVWLKDRDGRYIWVNRAFKIRYALEHSSREENAEGEILGKTDYELSPAFLADQFRLDDEFVLSGKKLINRIERVGEWNGPVFWNVTNKLPLYDGKGRIVGSAGVTRHVSNPGAVAVGESALGPALDYICARYEHPITNEQLAAVSKMSLRAFERQFLANFHLTPQKYIRKMRLSLASRALIFGNESLADVGLKCGFGDQSHFTREFRRQFGRTPREYREHYRSDAVFRTKSAASKQ
jgi:AraC-like DNA-binding protein